jgi:aminoglycoside phosphotransferase (APT) family kinase protein
MAAESPVPVEALEAQLDHLGLGSGPIRIEKIGDGHSNVTCLITRGTEKLVLRCPPPGPLAPSTHDVMREARLLEAVRPAGIPAPEVLHKFLDPGVIGVPFYLMTFVPGVVLTDRLPREADAAAPEAIAESLTMTLASIHEIDVDAVGLAGIGRPSGYLERQLQRFGDLLERHATRPLPGLERVREWLQRNRPTTPSATLVHGDYRLGNVMFNAEANALVSVLDWEMATIGDPLADLGYLTAMWAEPGDIDSPARALAPLSAVSGFPSRSALARRYAERSGVDISALPWYQVLAIWKLAIILEGSYRRYLAGGIADDYLAGLGPGIEQLSQIATDWAAGGGPTGDRAAQ